ncbi:hypothetical protein RTF02_003812 [Salmonella enterica subsp. enterica]|nr:hypothetical protein [Salmonella enterica]ELJ2931537.1 hypothetical protein [Salmonella enterica subsp. enterica]
MLKKAVFYAGLAIMMGNSVQPVAAQLAASVSTDFTVNITPPPCYVTSPSAIPLGDVNYNQSWEGTPFEISIRCDSSVRTALTATAARNTIMLTDTTLAFMMNGKVTGASLALLDTSANNAGIKFTGNDTDTFCSGDQDRFCSIKPKVTTGLQNMADGGEATAVVKFNLIYL